MPQTKRKRSLRKQPQRYDTSFKEWVEQRAHDVLPLLLPGAVYEGTLNVETARSMVRADKVFKVLYYGEEHILHLEFETGLDTQLSTRLLVYNAGLHRDHRLPVITIVVYPFRVQPAVSPLRIISNKREILTFHFRTLPLFTLEAEQFVREQRACMYPLLPTMQGVHADLLAQVMQELTELYRDDEVTLAQQYEWMMLFLERTDTIQPLEKGKIEERLTMYDRLWEESPRVQKTKARLREEAKKEAEQYKEQIKREAEAKTRAEIEAKAKVEREGETRTLRRTLVHVTHARFPNLTEIVQQRVELFDKPEALDLLIQQIAKAPDANTARWLLDVSTEAPE